MYEGKKKVTFAECNIEITQKIYEYLTTLFRSTLDKPPLLQHDATKSTMILPVQYTSDIVAYIVDDNTLRRLQNMQVINWCMNIRNLTPLPVLADGNSMAHSVCVYIFGVQDEQLHFRRMIYSMMFGHNNRESQLYIRLMAEIDDVLKLILRSKPSFHDDEKNKNFEYYLARCSEKRDGYGHLMPLEPVHVFILANIIARPIIVYTQWRGGSDIEIVQSIRFEGIYLPLLRKDAKFCEKSPIILGYDGGTFVPLLSTENVNLNQWSMKPASQAQHCAPLQRIDGSRLPVRFLKPQEKNISEDILNAYFDIVEIPTGPEQVLFAAMLKFKAPVAQSIELLWSTLEKVNKYIEQDRDRYIINTPSPNASFQIQQPIPCSRQKVNLCENNAFASGNNNLQMCDDCYNKYLAVKNTVKQRRQKPAPMPRQVSPPVSNQNYDQIVRKCLQCNINEAHALFDNMCKSCYDRQIIKNYKEQHNNGQYMTMKAPPRPATKQLICNLCETIYVEENEFGLCPACFEKNRIKQQEAEAERNRNQTQGELPYAGAAGGASAPSSLPVEMEEYKSDRNKLCCAVPGCMDLVNAYSNLCQKHHDQDRKKVKCIVCSNQAEENEYGLCLVCLRQQSNVIEEIKQENLGKKANVNIGRGAVNQPQNPFDDMNDFMSSLPMVPTPGDNQGNQMPYPAPYQEQQFPPVPEHQQPFASPFVYEGYSNADQHYGRQQGAMNWQKDKITPKCNYCGRPAQAGNFGMCTECARKKNGRQPAAAPRPCGNPDKPSCKNMVYDPEGFMCVECIDDQREAMRKLSGKKVERAPQEQEQYYPEIPPQQYNRCATAGCENFPEPGRKICQNCSNGYYPQFPQLPKPYPEMGQPQGHYQVPNQHPAMMQIDDQMQMGNAKQEKCKAFDCEFYGNPEYGGHCSSCFNEKTKNEARRQGRDFDQKIQANDLAGEQISYAGFSSGGAGIQNVVYPPVPPVNNPPVSPMRTPPQAQQMGFGFSSAYNQPVKCRNPNCEMYGRPEWDGMCSQCFKANRLERD